MKNNTFIQIKNTYLCKRMKQLSNEYIKTSKMIGEKKQEARLCVKDAIFIVKRRKHKNIHLHLSIKLK